MTVNFWWDDRPDEHYWLEITDRRDIGSDLNAPSKDERGRNQWSYDLLREASDGDVVFHFDKSTEAIVGFSFIRGDSWEDSVIWGARGTSARDKDVAPYRRPGFRRALQGFSTLDSPISLNQIRSNGNEILAVRASIEGEHGKPSYFPFIPYRGQQLRPFQGYMVKMPAAVVDVLGLPPIEARPGESSGAASSRGIEAQIGEGAAYRRADEAAGVSRAKPMSPDPALMERGLRGHRATQNALADALMSSGIDPLSPGRGDPDWDLAWYRNANLFVAEIKSITPTNEERQLRLGLGQVLRYRQALSESGQAVTGVLVPEGAPTDPSWNALCDELGVLLAWPDVWTKRLLL